MNPERNCQSCKYYKNGYCSELEMMLNYPEDACDYFSKRNELKEEAIERLKNHTQYKCSGEDLVALDMAIQALKQMDALDKIRAEIEQEIAYKPMEMWDYRMGLTKALDIIDKYRKE